MGGLRAPRFYGGAAPAAPKPEPEMTTWGEARKCVRCHESMVPRDYLIGNTCQECRKKEAPSCQACVFRYDPTCYARKKETPCDLYERAAGK